jgi:hypothetical protein
MTKDELSHVVDAELSQPVPAAVTALADAVRGRHGRAVQAILFYGSCLRADREIEGVADFYVLVDRYRSFYDRRLLAALNGLLAPNVLYVEADAGGRTVRAKAAVVSLRRFAYYTSARCFQPYFWARFAQPCALAYAAGPHVREQVVDAVADAVTTLVRRALPLVPPRFTPGEIWLAALTETYRTEVRPDRAGAPRRLYEAAAQRYEAVTRAALGRLPYSFRVASDGAAGIEVDLPRSSRVLAPWSWRLRRWQGKTLSLLRILKAALTFQGGVEYAVWKVERHSGEKVDPRWRESRHRWLTLGSEVWRRYRKGSLR